MNIDECFELGYIIKPHGLTGAVDIYLDADFPESYQNLESVFVNIRQKLVPFFISKIQIHGNKAIVKFEGVQSIDRSNELKGCTLHLPESELPELKENDFYFHEVIGFEVSDHQEGKIGKVIMFYDIPGQPLLAVDHKGKEILIPVNNDIIIDLARENKMILVKLPEGLLDVYLNP